MSHGKQRLYVLLLASVAVLHPDVWNASIARQVDPGATTSEDIEFLSRGPVHEAFAVQVDQNVGVKILAPRKPPDVVDEVPPDVKPEGGDVQWIPGYWHWDEERSDFIWVSGVWRSVPPGRRWLPGYWVEVDGQHRWIAGYWSAPDVPPSGYSPDPPESIDSGPSSIAPSNDHFWVPGCWLYRANDYRWRPGYWLQSRLDWVWTPAHYLWTPRGCLYVSGYWDHALSRRGVLFCPVRFRRYAGRQHLHYTPSVTISASRVCFHLFIRSGCSRYYFGDYYGGRHGRHRYYPWYDFHRVGRRYDPFYCRLEAWRRRDGVDYPSRYRDWHRYFAKHADRRPPRSFEAQRVFEKRYKNTPHAAQSLLARNLKEARQDVDSKLRLVRVDRDHHREVTLRKDALRRRGAERSRREAKLEPRNAAAANLAIRGSRREIPSGGQPRPRGSAADRRGVAASSPPNRFAAARRNQPIAPIRG